MRVFLFGAGDRTTTRFARCISSADQSPFTAFRLLGCHLSNRGSSLWRWRRKPPQSRLGLWGVVPVTGLEPVRSCLQGILSPWCLPFHHTGRCSAYSITDSIQRQEKA